jgi:hypothetical protein
MFTGLTPFLFVCREFWSCRAFQFGNNQAERFSIPRGC